MEGYGTPVIAYQRYDFEELMYTAKTYKVAFFSVYVWNAHFCHALAKALKEANPEIKIIMGGPQIPKDDIGTYFITNYYVDAIVEGEGELAAEKILLSILDDEPLQLIYKEPRIKDLSILPSPYLEGHFDFLLEDNTKWDSNTHETDGANIEWIPTIETDRGCPYGCTFCDWGSATASKMFKIPMDRIMCELDWCGDHQMDYIALTSSNFGIYKDRDLEIAKKIVEVNKSTGFPKGISVSYAKNSNETVFEIVKMFTEAGIQTGLMVSLQSTTPDVLDIIKRKNMKVNDISDIAAQAKERGLPLFTELILGLPAETPKSWEQCLEDVLRAGISNFDIFYLQLLENSPMNMTQVEDYNLKTFKAFDYFYGTADEVDADKFPEGVQVIKSTSTMNSDEILESSMLSWFITGMHMYGSTNIIADYLYTKHKISYIDFYKDLRAFMREQYPEFKNWEDEVRAALENWQHDGMLRLRITNLDITGWEVFHSLAMMIHWTTSYYTVDNVVAQFLSKQYDLSEDVITDHSEVATAQINKFNTIQAKSINLKSDLLNTNYVNVMLRYSTVKNNLEDHCKYLVMARRRAWHLNVIENTGS
jgi:putative methyltransferase